MKVTPPLALSKKHLTKKEISIRKEVEDRLTTVALPSEPPSGLTETQQVVYTFLYNNLINTGYVGILDSDILVQGAITIGRLRDIDRKINESEENLYDAQLANMRDKYFKQFVKMTELLALSPVARAKLGAVLANSEKKDPLADVLGI